MKKLLSILLALVIGVSASLNAFAASATKKYVSDIITYAASSAEEAEKGIQSLGYRMVKDSNLNSTLKTGVYLGYKETSDPERALTDIAAMNMTGKYSYSDYKQIMETFREHISETINNFLPTLAEFQDNYMNDDERAILTYNTLNAFENDDAKMLMGDYLLGYDFTDESEKELTDTFMQANTQVILTIMNEVTYAADPEESTFIERMAETGPDGIIAKYTKVYPTVAKANQAMNAEYGTAANIIYKDWDGFYSYLRRVEKELVKQDANGEPEFALDFTESREINVADGADAGAQEFEEAVENVLDATDFSLYSALASAEYGDGTLLDFFKRPASEINRNELYTLVDSLSEGQRSQIGITGIRNILISAFSEIGDDAQTQEALENHQKLIDNAEPLSIFSGVDRSIFEDGVAFTDEAVQHERLTGESWIEKLMGTETQKEAWLKAIVFCSVATVSFMAIGFVSAIIQTKQYSTAKAIYDNFSLEDEMLKSNLIEAEDKLWKVEETMNNAGKTAGIIKYASFFLFVVAFVADIYAIVEYFNDDYITEEDIPHHLLTTAQTPYGEDYVYYSTVKNQAKEAADVNNHEGDKSIGWLVLYSTKDKSAGDPILVSNLKVVRGIKNISAGMSFIHLFNEIGALNVTNEIYTGVKETGYGTYVVFDRDASIFAQGSAITNGTAAIIGVGGLALGAVLGAVITKLAGRKKKKEEETVTA